MDYIFVFVVLHSDTYLLFQLFIVSDVLMVEFVFIESQQGILYLHSFKKKNRDAVCSLCPNKITAGPSCHSVCPAIINTACPWITTPREIMQVDWSGDMASVMDSDTGSYHRVSLIAKIINDWPSAAPEMRKRILLQGKRPKILIVSEFKSFQSMIPPAQFFRGQRACFLCRYFFFFQCFAWFAHKNRGYCSL